ncbi:MAG: F0F1 ATP synthase subunit delta [Bacteroidaceae bacterium]|nr:F0F1 ATP synthase subunit delta [Bacteroidaceae bacterium]
MDIGVISVRYARALLKAATEGKSEESVYATMQTLAKAYLDVPQMRQVIENPMVSNDVKWQVMLTAAGNTESELVKNLLQMVLKTGREKMLQYIANSYITLYRQQNNIITGKITTSAPVSQDTVVKLRSLIEKQTNGKVDLETAVDPELIGGFILEYDTYRIDASVKKQLNSILKQLN